MVRKIAFASAWLALVSYSIIFTVDKVNSSQPDFFQQDLDLIINMSVLEWDGINPIIIAIFFIMGIFPLVYGAFILFDSKEQKVSPVPFFVTSFGLGAFTLLPYFVIRQPDTKWDQQKSWLLKVLDSRLMAIICSVSILVFLVWGAINGDWSDFVAQWHSSQFVHIMSIDFGILSILIPFAILKDDLERRGVKNKKMLWAISLVPIFGSLIYWCVRPQLSQYAESSAQNSKLIARN